MPLFGEFETVQQISITEEPRFVTTVWKARKSGGTDGRFYVIKCYAPRPGRMTPGQPQEVLEQDWSLSFLDGIKRLKRAHAGDASCLAPVHAFGVTPEGAWFATDYYERSTLKEYIDLLGRVNSEALRQVVCSVVTGCLAIKHSSEGKAHGNLKPSNVLLAGKPCPLQRTPLHLTDPHPAPRQLAALGAAGQRTGSEGSDPMPEIQDLRAIGELILQLVEGRLFRNAYEYNYPVVRSDKWDKLGKAGESWRALCNRLLDPRLSLEKESLEKLRLEYRPPVAKVKPQVILSILGAVVLVGLTAYLVSVVGRWNKGHRAEQEQRFQQYTNAAGLAYQQGNYANAVAEAARALAIRAHDPVAIKIRDDAQRELNQMEVARQQDQEFRRLTNAAGLAYRQGNPTNALAEAVRALNIRTNDPVALQIKDDAQRLLNQMEVVRQQDQEFRRLTNAAGLAYRQGNPTNALAEAVRALNIKTNDPVAIKIRDDAQRLLNQLELAREQEQEFRRLTNAAGLAYRQGNPTNALAEAVRALNIRTNDPVALQIKDDAQRLLNQMEVVRQQDQEFRRLTNAAGLAYRRGDPTNALAEAIRALNIKTNDPVALQIKDDAQRGIGRAEVAREQEQEFRRLTNAAGVAYRQGNPTNALAEAVRALNIKTNDSVALQIKDDAQRLLNQLELAREQEQEFRRLTNAAGLAYRQGNPTNALAEAVRALNIKTNDPVALQIKDDAQRLLNQLELAREQEQEFRRLTNAAGLAYRQGDPTNALAEAIRALNMKTNDPVALQIKGAAQRQLNQLELGREQEQEFRRLTNAAGLAYRQGDPTNALAEAIRALNIKTNDPVALKIKDDVQRQLNQLELAREQEQEFQRLTNAAGLAFEQGNFTNARAHAVKALNIHSNDPVAMRLRSDSQREINRIEVAGQQEREFRRLTNAAGLAYGQGSFTNARAFAVQALAIHSNDPVAVKIREDARARLDLSGSGKRPGRERPGSSNLVTVTGYDPIQAKSMAKASDLMDKKVLPKGSYNSLGKLEDIVIDLAAGRLVMAMVSSGSDQSAARPVPPGKFLAATALSRVIDWDKKTFLSVPPVPKANWTRELKEPASTPAGYLLGTALMGRPLASQTGESLGRVEDLIVDFQAGRVVTLVVKPVGSDKPDQRLYVLPPDSVHLDTDGGPLMLRASREHFVRGPYSTRDYASTELLTPGLAIRAYKHYAPQGGEGGSS